MASLVFFCSSAAAKKKACFITLNSDNEKKVMSQNLPKEEFDLVELVQELPENSPYSGSDNPWLEKACKEGVKCDILVISGHFAGGFFGDKSPWELDVSELHERKCSNSCSGILAKPSEVFLMGCNTLASKKRDNRTQEEYVQALVDHGVPRSTAERVSAVRYSPFGDSMDQNMKRIFSGVKNIYGFESVGPSGSSVESKMRRYMKSIPNYSQHLDNLHQIDAVEKMEEANSMLTGQKNVLLAEAMGNTHFIQCHGLTETQKNRLETKKYCQLSNPDLSIEEMLSVMSGVVAEGNLNQYLPLMEKYLQNRNLTKLSDEERKALKKFGENKEVRSRINSFYEVFKDTSPNMGLKFKFLKYALSIESKSTFEAYINESAIKSFKSKSGFDSRLVSKIARKQRIQVSIPARALPKGFEYDQNALSALYSLRVADSETINSVWNTLIGDMQPTRATGRLHRNRMKWLSLGVKDLDESKKNQLIDAYENASRIGKKNLTRVYENISSSDVNMQKKLVQVAGESGKFRVLDGVVYEAQVGSDVLKEILALPAPKRYLRQIATIDLKNPGDQVVLAKYIRDSKSLESFTYFIFRDEGFSTATTNVISKFVDQIPAAKGSLTAGHQSVLNALSYRMENDPVFKKTYKSKSWPVEKIQEIFPMNQMMGGAVGSPSGMGMGMGGGFGFPQ